MNGVAGANAFAYGGGKSTCCGSISGDKADITWTLDITHEQYLKGMRLETRRTVMAMPVRQWGENYLHVYFLSGDRVYLWWSTGFNSPTAEDIAAKVEQKRQQNMQR